MLAFVLRLSLLEAVERIYEPPIMPAEDHAALV